MHLIVRLLITFVLLSVVTSFAGHFLGWKFGTTSYWDVHGLFFLVTMFFFPRLTLLFSSVASGGFFWWVSWLFWPRLLTAVLATFAYWETNAFLVVCSWIWAFGLETTEKVVVHRRVVVRRHPHARIHDPDVIDV